MNSHPILLAGAALLALLLQADPACAQVDLSGNWMTENHQDFHLRLLGPEEADFLGVPLNAEARAAALSYTDTTIEDLNRQCEPWEIQYLTLAGLNFKMRSLLNPISGEVQAWYIGGTIDRMPIAIWMDGRQHPSAQAQHTYNGYTTGEWHGDTLVTTTTGIRDGYLTRAGVPSSNQETLTMFITRHGDLLTITAVYHDPVYLTAPYVQNRTWRYRPSASSDDRPMTCMPEEELPGFSDGYHFSTTLPGKNQWVTYQKKLYHIPVEATLGGEQTMFPEFLKKLKREYTIPAGYCTQYCCGSSALSKPFMAQVLQCKGSSIAN